MKAVANWSIPKNLKQLRGFLGLSSYYRRSIKCYGILSKPLAELFKKDNFHWTSTAETTFLTLKNRLITAPILALLDHDKVFTIETDACNQGIRAILMQDSHPMAYISKALALKHLSLSMYEKELLTKLIRLQSTTMAKRTAMASWWQCGEERIGGRRGDGERRRAVARWQGRHGATVDGGGDRRWRQSMVMVA